MPISYETLIEPGQIAGLNDTRVVASQQWNGTTWELHNHEHGWILVTGPDDARAIAYAIHADGDRALRQAAANAIIAAARTHTRWDDYNQAAVAASADGASWALAWVQAGEPGISRHDDGDSAHLALASRLEEMAAGPVYTGSNMEDEIARAQLLRAAAVIRADVATAQLGDVVRHWRPHLQESRQTAGIGRKLQISRRFLYRVLEGAEWRRRWSCRRDEDKVREVPMTVTGEDGVSE